MDRSLYDWELTMLDTLNMQKVQSIEREAERERMARSCCFTDKARRRAKTMWLCAACMLATVIWLAHG